MYEKFAELLDKTNKTAYQVSKDTGISQSVLSDWKRGRSNVKTDKLKILADYFGVSIEERCSISMTLKQKRKESEEV